MDREELVEIGKEFLAKGDFKSSRDFFVRANEISFGDDVNILLAKSLCGLGEYANACEILDDLSLSDNISIKKDALISLAELYLSLDDFERSEEYAKQAYLVDDNDTYTLELIGNIKLHLGKLKEAKEEYAEAIALTPFDEKLLNKQAALLNSMADYLGAEIMLDRVNYLKDVSAEFNVNYAISMLGQGKLEKAEEAINKSLLIDCDYEALYVTLSAVYKRLEKHNLAIDIINKAVDKQIYNDDILYSLADLKFTVGDNKGALGALQSIGAYSYSPKMLEASIYIEEHEYDKSMLSLMEILRSSDADEETENMLLDLFLLLEKEGLHDLGKKASERLIDLDYKGVIIDNIVSYYQGAYTDSMYNEFIELRRDYVGSDFRAECLPKIKKVFTDLCGENAEIDKTSNLIEIGYSDIEFSGILASYYSNISVIDASGELVEQAKKADVYIDASKLGLKYFAKHIKATFDVVVCVDYLKYYGDFKSILMNLRKNLSADAVLMLGFFVEDCESFSHKLEGVFSHSDDYIRQTIDDCVLDIFDEVELQNIELSCKTLKHKLFLIKRN